MTNTRHTQAEAFDHLLKTVLGWNDFTPAFVSIIQNGYTTITDIITMDNDEIDDMTYENASIVTSVPRVQKKMLKHVLLYYKYEISQRASQSFDASDWLTVTSDSFADFRSNIVPKLMHGVPARVATSQSLDSVSSSPIVTSSHVDSFDALQRRDIKNYVKFNGKGKFYFRTLRQWRAQARVDNVSRVFDLDTTVPVKTTADYQLWERQNAFVMSMLNTNIVGGQAQTIVRTHSIDGDAHAVMQEFHAHYASKGNVTALRSDFHRELSLLQLTPRYPGGPTQFIQTFQSLYLDLEDATGKTVNDEEKVGQLSASVIGHPTFSTIMSNLALIAKANNGTVKYCDAIDEFIRKSDEVSSNRRINPSNARSSSGNRNGPRSPARGQGNGRGPVPGRTRGSVNRDNPRPVNPGSAQYHNYLPRAQYDALSPEQRSQLHTSRQRNVNSTSVTATSTPSAPHVPVPSSSLTESISDNTMTTAPSLRAIFASRARPPANEEVTINDNGSQYSIRRVSSNRVIHVNLHDVHATNNWGLIDGGANNGMAGAAMREMDLNPHEFVDVIGATDGVDLVNLPVGTYCAKIQAVGGQNVIGVFNNYAGYGKGKSVISKFQCTAWGVNVFDTPRKHGGEQKMVTPDGYVFRFKYIDGGLYLPMTYPTDSELDSLPHVDFTSPGSWDPTSEVDDHNDEAWFNELDDPDALDDNEFFHVNNGYFLPDDDAINAANGFAAIANVNSHTVQRVKRHNWDYDNLRKFFLWRPVQVIQDTLAATTQYARQTLRLPLRRHYKSRFPALNVRRLDEDVATDTYFANVTAHDGSTCAQLYVGKLSLLTKVFGMKSDGEFPSTLLDFIRSFGAMNCLISDNAKADLSSAVKNFLRQFQITARQSEPYYQNQNPAERRIQFVKSLVRTLMDRTGSPSFLWLLCTTHVCYVLNHMSHDQLKGLTPIQRAFGYTPDVSAILCFSWYQKVLFYEEHRFPDSRERSGHFVGISENVGDALTFLILTEDSHEVLSRSDVRPFFDNINPNLRTASQAAPTGSFPGSLPSPVDGEDENLILESISTGDANSPAPVFDPVSIIGLSFLRERDVDGSIHRAIIVERIFDDIAEDDSEYQYLVKFGDGSRTDVMTYNDLIHHLNQQHSSDKPDGERLWIFNSIEQHKRVDQQWFVLVKWEDGSATWEPLSIIAKDDPVTCAHYARNNNLLDTPGWKRFRRLALNRKVTDCMMKKVRLNSAKYKHTRTWKFGVQIPSNYNDAKKLDNENGNSLWMDATSLEMAQLDEYECFEDLGPDGNCPPGYKRIKLHLIYDCKHDLRRKCRCVAGGHMTEPPVESPYSSGVSLQSLRMMMFIGELNGYEMCAGDIGNAYLESICDEKVAFVAGPEFGARAGHLMIIKKALYGLRTSGSSFYRLLASVLHNLAFFPSKADPDIWMRDCKTHWEYVATYVDDLLYVGKNSKNFLQSLLDIGFKLKGVGMPKYHLGGDFKRVDVPEKLLTWGSYTFVNKMLKKYEQLFGEPVPKSDVHAPLEPGDHPELDDSPLCDANQTHMFMSMIGDMQWAVSLGRIDIFCATMCLSTFRAMPRIGHLERAKRVYKFLRNDKKTSIKFRTDMPNYSAFDYVKPDWGYIYHPCQEDIPTDTPEPRGKPTLTTSFVDANLLFDLVTGRSAAGIIHLLNKTPVSWFSKKLSTVETSTYGSEFSALRIAVEQVMSIRQDLRYLGVPVAGPSYLFCDNKAVVDSSVIPSYRLKKRHNILSWHTVRQAVACDIVRIVHIDSKNNPADILTKHRSSREWYELCKPIIFWAWRDDENVSVTRPEGSDNTSITSRLVTEM